MHMVDNDYMKIYLFALCKALFPRQYFKCLPFPFSQIMKPLFRIGGEWLACSPLVWYISVSNHGKVTPKNHGKVTPKNHGKVTPKTIALVFAAFLLRTHYA